MTKSAEILAFKAVVDGELSTETASLMQEALDQEIQAMIDQLEKVTTCQQVGSTGLGLDGVPAFAAFCAGLETIGDSLLPHFRGAYLDLCAHHRLSPDLASNLYRERANGFIQYLVQLAQVHGLAFEGAPDQIGAFEKGVLANFEAKLWLKAAL